MVKDKIREKSAKSVELRSGGKRGVTMQQGRLIAAIPWDVPRLVHLESCNSCGTNTSKGT